MRLKACFEILLAHFTIFWVAKNGKMRKKYFKAVIELSLASSLLPRYTYHHSSRMAIGIWPEITWLSWERGSMLAVPLRRLMRK